MAEKKWYEEAGGGGDAVLSTRIRIARNIDGFPFPCRLSAAGISEINRLVTDALATDPGLKLHAVDVGSLGRYKAVSLAERHLISPEFAGHPAGKALLLSENESISIMLCEEDHIRIQVIVPGFELDGAYAVADKIDNILDSRLKFAFDEKLGYLTQNPSNLGTGVRSSVMIHLPALSKSGQMPSFAATVSKLGLSVRGMYGEGVAPHGDIYQLSNLVTLGISEKESTDNLKAITMQLATKERNAAEQLVRDIGIKDRINRSYALLQSAFLLSTSEMLDMLSWVRLGVCSSLIEADLNTISELFITMQPATLNDIAGRQLSTSERDELRAGLVRDRLNKRV